MKLPFVSKNIFSLEQIWLEPNKKIYFASDFHLGAPNHAKSLERERKICSWLDSIKTDAQMVFLVGDLFDFWFEYKHAVPKGYIRFLGKLAELSDMGIKLVIFTGNHDMWQRDYFEKELKAVINREPKTYLINDRKFLIGHGDGLGPGDYGYKILKKIFNNSIAKFMFGSLLHPSVGLKLGYLWAGHSWARHEKQKDVYVFETKEKEILYNYCEEIEAITHHDYYIFGHRHYKFDLKVGQNSRYINLGDWIKYNSFASFDGQNLELKT